MKGGSIIDKNYIMYHCHSDDSLLDSCSKFSDYVELALLNGQKAIASTEHGKPISWVTKKMLCDKVGIRFIHGVEIYLTESLEEKIRDNYHTVLLARNLEGVKEYLSNLVESDNEVWGEVRYCENMTMNTVLAVYERRAKENGIAVKISAEGSRDLNVLPQDLVIVIANLFENAINATAKLKKNDKRIDILIKESSQRLVIKVENPCKANLSFDESGYGVGIRSVIATTSKYEGMYDFTVEDGIFSAKVILNLK